MVCGLPLPDHGEVILRLPPDDGPGVPVLEVRIMTPDEEAEVRRQQEAELP